MAMPATDLPPPASPSRNFLQKVLRGCVSFMRNCQMNPRATNRMVEKNSALAVEYPWIISTTSRAMGIRNTSRFTSAFFASGSSSSRVFSSPIFSARM